MEAPSSSKQDEVLPDTDDSEKYFIAHIFWYVAERRKHLMDKVKLMEWILQMKNVAVLYWHSYIIVHGLSLSIEYYF